MVVSQGPDTIRRVTESDLLRRIPQVDAVLRHPSVLEIAERWGPPVASWLVQAEVSLAREAARRGVEPGDASALAASVAGHAADLDRRRIRRVINATGVVLHTNLGRAPLSAAAIDAVRDAAGYAAVEYDIDAGDRGQRAPVASTLLAALTGAEAALVVNNNAGALLLALAAIARGREVVVSRGEMIEIGGEFRLPEVMEASGAILREVGTTNRTHAKDYRKAIGERTALVLKVHPSNYRVVGFTKEPALDDVLAIAHEADVPVLYDVGSGLLRPDDRMPGEPDASSAIAAGCDLVCFSGDKLLGGPQAGVLAGRQELVELCRRNPIARAVRADKLTLAAMEATALAHSRGRTHEIPAIDAVATSVEELEARAQRIVGSLPLGSASVVDAESVTGGGSLPGRSLPSKVAAILHAKPEAIVAALRSNDPPVIARVEGGRVILDLRTVVLRDDEVVAQALRTALGA